MSKVFWEQMSKFSQRSLHKRQKIRRCNRHQSQMNQMKSPDLWHLMLLHHLAMIPIQALAQTHLRLHLIIQAKIFMKTEVVLKVFTQLRQNPRKKSQATIQCPKSQQLSQSQNVSRSPKLKPILISFIQPNNY